MAGAVEGVLTAHTALGSLCLIARVLDSTRAKVALRASHLIFPGKGSALIENESVLVCCDPLL